MPSPSTTFKLCLTSPTSPSIPEGEIVGNDDDWQIGCTSPRSPTIPEGNAAVGEDGADRRTKDLDAMLAKLPHITSTTESIGHRNVVHRRTQSSSLFSILDTPQSLCHRSMRSMSLAEFPPSMDKFFPGSHLLDENDNNNNLVNYEDRRSLYLSLWLLPPKAMEQRFKDEITKLSLKYNKLGSSAPFVPHITIVGSIRCETNREVKELGQRLQKKLQQMKSVPCRFYDKYDNRNRSNTDSSHNINGSNSNDGRKRCHVMHNEENQLVWSQSCIALMERSDEYMALLAKAREVLGLPQGGTFGLQR